MGFVMVIINTILWMPCLWLLQLLDVINQGMNYLTGDILEAILFGKKVTNFEDILLPAVYYRIGLFALFMWVIMFVGTILTYVLRDMSEMDDTPLGKKVAKAFKYSFIGMALFAFMPLAIWLIVKFSTWVMGGVNVAFGGESLNIANLLYNLGNPNWDGTIVDKGGDFSIPSDIADWNMIVELFGIVVITICLVLVLINIILTTCVMFFYFICTAFFATTMVFDQGKRMKEYMQTTIANVLIITTSMFIFNVFGTLLGMLNTALNSLGIAGILKMLLGALFAIGGALFVVQGDQYVSRLIGENMAGVSSAMNALGMVKAGVGMATGLGVGAAMLAKKGGSAIVGKRNASAIGQRFSNWRNRKNNDSGSSASSAYGGNSPIDGSGGSENSMNENVHASNPSVNAWKRGGLMGLMGIGAIGGLKAARGIKNVFGSFLGSKKSRLESRARVQASMSAAGSVIKTKFSQAGTNIKNATSASTSIFGATQYKDKLNNRADKYFVNEGKDNVKQGIHDKTISRLNKKSSKFEMKSGSAKGLNTKRALKMNSKNKKVQKQISDHKKIVKTFNDKFTGKKDKKNK